MNNSSPDPMWSTTFYDENGREHLPSCDLVGGFGAQFPEPELATINPESTAYPQVLRNHDVLPPTVPQEHQTEAIPGLSAPTVLLHSGLKRKRLTVEIEDDGCSPATSPAREIATASSTVAAPVIAAWTQGNVGHNDLAPVNNHGQPIPETTSQLPVPSSTSPATGPVSASYTGPHTCPKCSKRVMLWSDLWKHQRKYVPEEQRPYPCGHPDCAKRFWFPKDVLRHHMKKHGGVVTRCLFPNCDVAPGTHDKAYKHIGAAHRDPNSPKDPTIVTNYMGTLSVSSFNSPARSSVFSAPPTPQTPWTTLSSHQSTRSFGYPSAPYMDHIQEEYDDFQLFD